MSQDQLSLFAGDSESSMTSLFEAVTEPTQSEIDFSRWSFYRHGIMASYFDKKWNFVWTEPVGTKGNCSCLNFAKNAECTHTKNLELWAVQKFNLSQTSLGTLFEQSLWIGLGQKWFQEWGPLHPKVKLPSVLQLLDGSGKVRVQLQSKQLGQLLYSEFYGFLSLLSDEELRRLRISEEVNPLDWVNFYHQNINSTELNLKAQNLSTTAMLYDESILGNLMKHCFVFFESTDSNPTNLQLEKDGLSINFAP